MDDGVIASVTDLDFGEPEFVEHCLPHCPFDIVGDIHCPTVGDDKYGVRCSVGQLEEGIFHLDLILQDGLLDIVEVLAIGGSEVD